MRIDPLLTISPITCAIRPITNDLLRETYLAPASSEPSLANLLADRPAPWAKSLTAAPEAASRAVASGLVGLAHAVPELDPAAIDLSRLPQGRAHTHLTALRDLWSDLGALPGALDTWAHVMRRSKEDALEPLPLFDYTPCLFATPAETALAETLVAHHGVAGTSERIARAPGALGQIQAYLGRASDQIAQDDSLAFFGLRDPQQEAEFAAARIQQMLDSGQIDAPSEAGLLVPEDATYLSALREAFDRLGLPLSGLPTEPPMRDIARETLLLLFTLLENPYASTARASLFLTPHMPWSREAGRKMAAEIMQRGWSRTASGLDGDARLVIDALRLCSTADQVAARLGVVARAAPKIGLHSLIAQLRPGLQDPLDWQVLRRIATPNIPGGAGHDRFVEGVSLFEASALPWRQVRHLIVLGLNGGPYPRQPGTEPFFTEGEIAQIHDTTGLRLTGRKQRIARGIEMFRRQLCAATESATFLAPALDMTGGKQSPSTGFALIAHLLGAEEAGDLVQDIRAMPERDWPVAAHPVPPMSTDDAPDLPEEGQLWLGSNLLHLRQDEEGQFTPQSPSRLERLITSPLAWLLEELGATDRTWAPDEPDVMVKGTLLHRVMETLFPPGAEVPSPDTITAKVGAALDEAIARNAPWMEGPIWTLERNGLRTAAKEAAIGWAEFLRSSGAKIIKNEITLSGQLDDQDLIGSADCLLRLENGTVLIVDHKSGKSDKRRTQMQAGWDLQLALYREMIRTPIDNTALDRLSEARIGTAYHTFSDNTVLIDKEGGEVTGAQMLDVDSSAKAMSALKDALEHVGGGTVTLNREGDAEAIEAERGVKPYALDNPFVSAFLMPAPEEDAE